LNLYVKELASRFSPRLLPGNFEGLTRGAGMTISLVTWLDGVSVLWRTFSGPGAFLFVGVERKLPLALLVVNTNGNNIFHKQ
jgi:hypothetical protein